MTNTWRILPILWLALLLAGCSASPWHKNYISSLADSPALEPVQNTQVRVISQERFENAFAAIEHYADSHNLAPEDFTPKDILAVNTVLFKTLRLKDPPETLTIIGHTSFTHTARLDPKAGHLQSLAADQGAHYAIAATHYLGRKQTIESLPISSTTYTTVTHKETNAEGNVEEHSDTASSRTTTWVPRTVTREYWAHRAVLIRRVSKTEQREMNAR